MSQERSTPRAWKKLNDLGFESYAQYLASDHWHDFKVRYKADGRSMHCAVCSSTPIQLHHHDYARLGSESLDDVTPLCRPCHYRTHKLLRNAGLSVLATQWAMHKIKERLSKQKTHKCTEDKKKRIPKEESEYLDKCNKAKNAREIKSAYAKFHAELRRRGIRFPSKRKRRRK